MTAADVRSALDTACAAYDLAYESAAASGWDEVVRRLERLLPGTRCALAIDVRAGEEATSLLLAGPSFEETFCRSYVEHYRALNPIAPQLARWPVGRVVHFSQFADFDSHQRGGFVDEWLAPQDLGWRGIGVVARREGSGFSCCLCAYPERGRDLTEQDDEMLALVGPHIGRAGELWAAQRPADASATLESPASDWRERLRELYGLTPAECALARLMVEGHNLAACADALGIARETARKRLKGIFKKVDVHHQGALVRLLLVGPARLGLVD